MELIKGYVSSNLRAWLANAFLLNLQDMCFLHTSINLKDIIIDKSKIAREKAWVKVTEGLWSWYTHNSSSRHKWHSPQSISSSAYIVVWLC